MIICYSVIPGDAAIFPLGAYFEGAGIMDCPRWALLDATDCVWIVPGTEEE